MFFTSLCTQIIARQVQRFHATLKRPIFIHTGISSRSLNCCTYLDRIRPNLVKLFLNLIVGIMFISVKDEVFQHHWSY